MRVECRYHTELIARGRKGTRTVLKAFGVLCGTQPLVYLVYPLLTKVGGYARHKWELRRGTRARGDVVVVRFVWFV